VTIEASVFWDDSPELWDTVTLAGAPLPGVARVTGAHGRKLDVKSAPGRNGARIVDKGYEPAKVEIALKLWTKEQLDAWRAIAPTLTFRREPPSTSARTGARARGKVEEAALSDARALLEVNVIQSVSTSLANSGVTDETKITAEINRELANASGGTRSQRARRLERHDVEISHPALDTIGVQRVYIEKVSAIAPVSPGVYEVKISAVESRAPTASSSRSVSGSTTAGQSFATGIRTAFDATGPSSNGGSAP